SGYGLYVSDVSVTVDGGSFSGSSALCAYATNTCQWRVNDGVFAGEAYGLDTTFYDGGGSSGSVSLTVAGGTFTGGSYGVSTDCAGSLAGGTFTGSDTLAYAVRNSAFSGTAAALLAPGKAYYDADGKTVDGSANDGIGEGKTLRVLDAGSAPAPLYSIGGTVVDSAGSSGVKGATVKLMQGKTQLAQTTTGSTGQYSFADIPAGLYNVVAETDEVTATILVELNTDAYDKDIRLPNGSKSSVVEVTGADTPDVIVGGVEEVAKNQSAGSDESITVKLTVEKQDSPANKDEIVAVAGDQTLLYLDVSLMLLKGSGEPQDLGSSNSKVLELVLPYDFTSKKDVTVYRYHGDNAGKLTKLDTAPSPAQDNTFWADTKNGYLHIYASQFSTYAVGYTPVTVNPGHSGGGSTPSYTITASAGAGGAISPSGKVSVTRNGSKTFTVTPNAGYIVADVLVDGKSAGAVTSYTFDKVTEAHTISARFEKAADKAAWNPFADVRESDWFYDSVKYVYEHDLMLGTSGTAFSPNAGTERGMIVTILWRMAGKPAAESGSAFSDVRSGAYYADAVAWADENGIVLGYGNGLFGPGDKITREQLAAILWRYAGSPAAGGALDGFADADSVSPYARDALRWAVEQNIVSGKGGGALDPKGPATRAEAAAMLERFSVSVK
ncbi:MAG: S-layer homology domain-containing protein, partial [Eubacteriales bacterium]|nr:S-layer homology domain-containing protein [Eubacteriales bacterium]